MFFEGDMYKIPGKPLDSSIKQSQPNPKSICKSLFQNSGMPDAGLGNPVQDGNSLGSGTGPLPKWKKRATVTQKARDNARMHVGE